MPVPNESPSEELLFLGQHLPKHFSVEYQDKRNS